MNTRINTVLTQSIFGQGCSMSLEDILKSRSALTYSGVCEESHDKKKNDEINRYALGAGVKQGKENELKIYMRDEAVYMKKNVLKRPNPFLRW